MMHFSICFMNSLLILVWFVWWFDCYQNEIYSSYWKQIPGDERCFDNATFNCPNVGVSITAFFMVKNRLWIHVHFSNNLLLKLRIVWQIMMIIYTFKQIQGVVCVMIVNQFNTKQNKANDNVRHTQDIFLNNVLKLSFHIVLHVAVFPILWLVMKSGLFYNFTPVRKCNKKSLGHEKYSSAMYCQKYW